MSTPAPLSRLAIAALVLGVLSALMVIVGLIWASVTEGLAILVPMFFTAVPTAIVGLAGVVVAIVALVHRSRPRWIGVVGLVLGAIPLTVAVVVLIQLILIFALANAQAYEFSRLGE
jgi:hypothetical protein